jgi:histidinol-phosphatase (PHP family)
MSSDSKRLFFDSHMHTPLCKHADGHPAEYAEQGWRAGLRGIIMTCHSPMPNGFSHRVRMDPSEFEDYVALVAEGASGAREGFEVRLGLESDYFPGMEEWLSELHRRANFHYILGSVHWHIPEYLDAFWTGDTLAFRRQYFWHLAESAESGLFDCLSHPDLIKNAASEEWDFEQMRPVIAEALDRIARTGVAMELNTSGLYKANPEMNPGPQMLAMMAERDIPVVIGSDSHIPQRVGDLFPAALVALENAGYDTVSLFENRKRQDLPIELVRESLMASALETV